MNRDYPYKTFAEVEQAATLQATQKPLDLAPYTETIRGTRVTFNMVPINGGIFTMGSSDKEPGHVADESPEQEVTIRPFWMGVMEVTWDEYDLFAFSKDIEKKPQPTAPQTTADAVTRPTPPYADESFGYGKGRQPVISITHHAAMEYCRWLTEKTGKLYRLPTEAEWEYACRAGAKTAYSFGDDTKK